MSNFLITVKNIPQLTDNYSYIIKTNQNNNVIIVDPAEPRSIINYVIKNQLIISGILLTHHHNDHTAGVKEILSIANVPVYSPDIKIHGTTNVVKQGDKIDLEIFTMDVKETPGHTLDHIIFYNKELKILFSGDTLFRLGCGKVFEGTYEQMFSSLQAIESLDDELMVYCGHEYSLNNLKFLQSVFSNHPGLNFVENEIFNQLSKNKTSIPFNLGKEKLINPFLSTKSSYFNKYKKNKKLSDFGMFSYLRELKNNFK